jgi:hypothetical protein
VHPLCNTAGLTSSALMKEVAPMKRIILLVTVASVAALMLVATAAPAFAFVHENVPADDCSGNPMAGANPTAGFNLFTKNPAQTLPLGQPNTAPVPAACQ